MATSLTYFARIGTALLGLSFLLSCISPANAAAAAVGAKEPLDHEQVLDAVEAMFQGGQPREAVATLAAAARLHPEDRAVASLLYGALRDRVWQIPQTRPSLMDSPVRALAFSQDGVWLASGAESGLVAVSETGFKDAAGDGARRTEFRQDGAIHTVFFSADGKQLFVLSGNGLFKIWDIATKRAVFEGAAAGNSSSVFAANRASGVVAIAAAGGVVNLFDPSGEIRSIHLDRAEAVVTAMSFSRDGRWLAVGLDDSTARVFRSENGEPYGTPIVHRNKITALDFSADGRYLLTCSADKTARLSDFDSSAPVTPRMDCDAPVIAGSVSPDGSRIATLQDDGGVRFWDALSGAELPFNAKEDSAIVDMAWSRSGLRFATASEAGHATIWKMRDGAQWGETLPTYSPVLAMEYSPEAEFLALGCKDGSVHLWRTDSGKAMPTVRAHLARARAAFYSLDGQHVITASEDHTALHWISGQVWPFGPALIHAGNVTCAAFDKTVSRILTCDDTGIAQLWSPETGRPEGDPFRHKSPVRWVDFHPEGDRFVAISGGSAFVWGIHNRTKPLAVITAPGKRVNNLRCARFSPDGQWLATASEDGLAHIWDAHTYKPVGKPIARGAPVSCVRFSPDSSLLLVAGDDAQVAIFSTKTWEAQGQPILLPGPVSSAAVTDDNQFVIATSFLLNAVQFFEAGNGRPFGRGPSIPSPANCVDYHLQDKVALVACDDGTVRAFGSPFVVEGVPPWLCDFAEHLIGLRQTEPGKFEPVASSYAELKKEAAAREGDPAKDFARLAGWLTDRGVGRHGMPRFTSVLADNVIRRVDERSLDALYECYEAAPGDPLVLAALSLYAPNRRQGEFLADMILSRKDSTPLARTFAAATLVNCGRSAEAEKAMAAAVAEDPGNARVLLRAAKLNARMGNKKDSIAQFEDATRLAPNDLETRRSYAWALFNLREPQLAATQFKLAEELSGKRNADLVAGRCLTAAAQGNLTEAMAAFKDLAGLDPQWADPEYLSSLKGWTEHEVSTLEQVRALTFPRHNSAPVAKLP